MICSSTTSRPAGLAAWLRVLVVALLVALAVPAIAMADEGTTGGAATAEQPAATGQPPVATETAATAEQSAATQPAPTPVEEPQQPVAETPAPAATEPTATEPVAEQPVSQEPAAPPAVEEPAPSAPPAPSAGTPVIDIPLPVIELPEIQIPLPVIPEVLPGQPPAPAGETAAPVPGVGELVPVLIAPEAPRQPTIGTIAPAPPPKAVIPPAPAVPATVAVSAQKPDPVTSLDLGPPPGLGGADPISQASRVAVDGAAASAAASVPLRGNLISLDPSSAPVAAPVVAGSAVAGSAFGVEDATARIAAPQLVSPVGPAPAQSLLAVLASYILPGSGPVPAGMIFVLVMLGVILLAAWAPRPGGSERIWLSGLLGPGSGHGLAVRRPG
ncbi:MAG TPA: hypothetical protein VFG74_16805 [Miltoncostaeaceae bacterium]|nr:hypothetical protein [Miltoncostaeaceae bacterium]